MDEMKKYECPDCGAIKEVEASAEAPACDDCGVTMVPVAEGSAEDTGEFEDWEEEEEGWGDEE
ncbi:MAG: hypothetical protein FJ044_00030 [Candidatus Cloacimonetes bacterium]|nr:hypothetical protein [Candidatus Cloacimonadota bacterium]